MQISRWIIAHEACSRYQRGQTKDYARIVNLTKRRENGELSAEFPCMVAAALRESDEMIGEITVMPKGSVISLGDTFSYKYHRRGYAFEALTASIEILHKNLHANVSIKDEGLTKPDKSFLYHRAPILHSAIRIFRNTTKQT